MEYELASGLIIPGSAFDSKALQQAADLSGGLTSPGSSPSRFRKDSEFLQAILIPWVYSCVSLIAYTFATNPIRLRNVRTDRVIEDLNNPVLALMARPNPRQSGFAFRELYATYAELTGTVYQTLEERNGDGFPRAMYLPNPAFVTPHRGTDGWPDYYAYDPTGQARTEESPGVVIYRPEEILVQHFANPLDGNSGLGVIEAGATLLNTISEMELHELAYWNSGGRITGVLQTDRGLSEASFNRIKRDWQAANADRKQRIRTAILEQGLNYKPISEGLAGLDLVNIAKAKRDQILAMFGVPLTKLGILEDAMYKLDDADRTFQSETMAAKYARHEDAMQPLIDLFDPEMALEHERVNFEDDSDKLDNAIKMQQLGFSFDEIRAYLGVDAAPKGSGDVVLLSSAVIPTRAEDIGEAADQNAAAAALAAQPQPPALGAPAPATPTDDSGDSNMVQLSDHLKAASVLRESKRWKRPSRLSEVAYKSLHAGTVIEHKAASPVKPPTKVSVKAPGLYAAMLVFKRRNLEDARDRGIPVLRSAYAAQRKPLSPRAQLPNIIKAGGTKERIRAAIDEVWKPEPLVTAVRQIHEQAAAAGYDAGMRLTGQKALEALLDTKAMTDIPPTLAGRLDSMGSMITNIDETMRGLVTDTIVEGIRRGYTVNQIAQGYAAEDYPGVAGVFTDADQWRAETIARTEAMRAFNAGSFVGFNDAGVATVLAMDGSDDPICAERNGNTFPLNEAETIVDHPNGTLTWVPATYAGLDLGPAPGDEGSLE